MRVGESADIFFYTTSHHRNRSEDRRPAGKTRITETPLKRLSDERPSRRGAGKRGVRAGANEIISERTVQHCLLSFIYLFIYFLFLTVVVNTPALYGPAFSLPP